MTRRQFITLLGGAAMAWPLATRAQQRERPRRIGVLFSAAADDADYQSWLGAFLQSLAESDWKIGHNVRIDMRWATSDADAVRRHAAELAAHAPDIILALGASTVGPLLQATRTVPIVFALVADPVGAGFVHSLARPGGNATGFMSFEYGLGGKWLELLKEIAPGATRVAVLRDSTIASGIGQFGVIQAMAPLLKVEVNPLDIREAGDIERSIADFARSGGSALILTASGLAWARRDLIIKLAAQYRLPASLRRRRRPSVLRASCFAARPAMLTASSRARNRPTCRCRRQPNTSLSSISRPRRRSASPCRIACSLAPTR
jgi:ABC-type uncharacterized transport system substrate-binding protein